MYGHRRVTQSVYCLLCEETFGLATPYVHYMLHITYIHIYIYTYTYLGYITYMVDCAHICSMQHISLAILCK